MSTAVPTLDIPKMDGLRVAVVQADWNGHITSALTAGAVEAFKTRGYDSACCEVFHVPGTVELTYAASALMDTGLYDGIVMVGCVVRGGTPHFDYVCQSVTHGMTELNLRGEAPVAFGVLTVDDEQQALDRAGGSMGNKGFEAMEALLAMVALGRKIIDISEQAI